MKRAMVYSTILSAVTFLLAWGLFKHTAFAHCDTLDGPVVKTAISALEKRDVASVLKWVKKIHEAEIRTLFQKTLSIRAKGPEAREFADMYFFETLVRLHRAGEGAPYTGLKPAGAVEPAVAAADAALESGSVDALVQALSRAVADGVGRRFGHAVEKKKQMEESVEAGRDFVEAYMEFVHFVERLHLDLAGHGHEHEK